MGFPFHPKNISQNLIELWIVGRGTCKWWRLCNGLGLKLVNKPFDT